MFILFGLNDDSDYDTVHSYFIGCFSTYEDANNMRTKLFEESGKARHHFFGYMIKEVVVGNVYSYQFSNGEEE